MPWPSTLTSAAGPGLAILGGFGAATLLYAAGIVLVLRTPRLETHAVYQHRLTLTQGKDLNTPEQFGFAHRQATPFYIQSTDGVRLHAWHVLPVGLYARHLDKLVSDDYGKKKKKKDDDFLDTLNFKLLRDDPEARLVIHTHGASGALTAYCRPEAYRSLSSLSPDKIHVLAFDYRGFGLSTAGGQTPTEAGVLADARAVFRWAADTAGIPPRRIVIFGQSLGGGVAIALARDLALRDPSSSSSSSGDTIAGLVVTSAFSSVPGLLCEYRLPGAGVRALGPLGGFPSVARFLTGTMRNQWPNRRRLGEFVRLSRRYHIELFHAEDDPIVPWHFSDEFLGEAVSAARRGSGDGIEEGEEKEEKSRAILAERHSQEKKARTVDLGEGGRYSVWETDKGVIRQEIMRYGLHDRLMASPQIAMAVARAFQSADPTFLRS